MFCPNCGTKNKDDAIFCKSCGSRFPEHQGIASEPTNAQPAQTEFPPQEPMAQQTPMQAPQANPTAPGAQAPLITTPQITVPAQGAAAHASNARGKVIGIGIACVVVVVLLVVLLMNVLGGGSSGTITREGEPSVVVDSTGGRVELIQRPTLVDISGIMDSLGAAPALAAYTSGSSPSLNGDSGSEGNELKVEGEEVEATNGYGSIESYEVDENLSNVKNAKDFSLTPKYDAELIDKLVENNFAVNASNGSNEFFDVYESNRYMELANFVTTDSIMHTYHLYFSYLLKNLEQNNLSSELTSLTHRLLDESIAQQQELVGTEWESAANRNVAFFGTALKLLDPSATVPSDVASVVDSEVAKINAAQGIEVSGITNQREDYSQYKPRGYYEGNETLERYFRAMMLYGRTHFLQDGSSLAGDADDLNRSALLINLALDDGTGAAADKEWESIYTVTSFFAGASDDCGFYEYFPLIKAAYGDDVDAGKLAGNTNGWNKYKDLTSKVEPPKISSVVVVDETQYDQDDIKGFRLMGQRFSLDEAIFQQLVYDKVDDRMLPSALDVPAALGSDVALDILEEEGQTEYPGYTEQMEKVRTEIAKAGDSVWQGSLYSQWLYTLNPLLVSKDDTYPAFMTSEAWDRKNLQTWQGSYTELKHDTILYSKQVMAEMGGGPIDHDDRGYVEPEPELYGRLSNLAQVTVAGLQYYGMISDADVSEMELLQEICDKLKAMSEKELAGTELASDEYDFIRTYGGQLEHFWDKVNNSTQKGLTKATLSPAPLVADIATDATNGVCLELAIGKVNSIYVVVPINGELHLTKGAVFSDYEFTVPISERMNDSTWRSMVGITSTPSKNMPDMVEWVDDFTVKRQN